VHKASQHSPNAHPSLFGQPCRITLHKLPREPEQLLQLTPPPLSLSMPAALNYTAEHTAGILPHRGTLCTIVIQTKPYDPNPTLLYWHTQPLNTAQYIVNFSRYGKKFKGYVAA